MPGARRWPASPPTRRATAARSSTRSCTSASTTRRASARCSSERGHGDRRVHRRAGDRCRRRLSRPSRRTGPRSSACAASTTSCSSPTRSSPASAGPASLWGSQRYGIEPDLVIVRQGRDRPATSRSAACSSGARVAAPFWDGSAAGPDVPPRLHVLRATPRPAPRRWPTSTSSSARVSSARVAALEPPFDGAIRRLEARPLVGEVRTVGLTAAVAIAPDRLAADPAIPARVVGAALRHGVATRVLRGHALQISPPFVITAGRST